MESFFMNVNWVRIKELLKDLEWKKYVELFEMFFY